MVTVLIHHGWGKALKTYIQWVDIHKYTYIYIYICVGAPKPLPWRGFFTLSFAKASGSVATLWIMCRPLVEGLRNESVSTLGVFDDSWSLLRHVSYLSSQHNCTQQLCPIRRDEYSHAYVWMWPSQGMGWMGWAGWAVLQLNCVKEDNQHD